MKTTKTTRSQVLERRRDALLNQLHRLPNLMRGKVYERTRKCGRPSCRCVTGGPRHTSLQMTVNIRGRTRTRYVRRDERVAVEAMLETYRQLWTIVEALTEVNLHLFHAEAAARRHP